jgi:hypothetical protein
LNSGGYTDFKGDLVLSLAIDVIFNDKPRFFNPFDFFGVAANGVDPVFSITSGYIP